jgi:hypothetical protein
MRPVLTGRACSKSERTARQADGTGGRPIWEAFGRKRTSLYLVLPDRLVLL